MIVITASRDTGCKTTCGQDGKTTAKITWRGCDGSPEPNSAYEEQHRGGQVRARGMSLLGAIDHYANLDLVSAELEGLETEHG